MGIRTNEDPEVAGRSGGDEVVGKVVEGGEAGTEVGNGGAVEGDEYALGEVEVEAREGGESG